MLMMGFSFSSVLGVTGLSASETRSTCFALSSVVHSFFQMTSNLSVRNRDTVTAIPRKKQPNFLLTSDFRMFLVDMLVFQPDLLEKSTGI